jgi:hypothetical protein
MAANFPGAGSALPGVYTQVVTLTRGVSVPSGTRLAAIMGEGARQETIVASAIGGGRDGLDPTYSSTNGSDGRHFALSNFPIVSNRTKLYKNGIQLALLEQDIDNGSFDNRFDARVEISTGHIELQTAQLVDQGGAFYSATSTNVGDGTISSLTLADPNAPTETWTARVTSVRRDGYGNAIDGYARFTVRGSVSGTILDGYGNQIIWQSNGVVVSNGILSFAINEGSTAFLEGDSFIIEVRGGALVEGDSLAAIYIAEADINDPQFFTDINALTAKHGFVSLQNRLSLGAQLAFANNTPGVYALETAPSIPRRISYILEESASGGATVDDLKFPLPLLVTPDANSNINFFILDPVTGVESQVIPNKVDFYDPTITSNPAAFQIGGGYDFSYTVVLEDSVQKESEDGVITSTGPTTGTLSSALVQFNTSDTSVTRSVQIYDATNPTNNGTFTVLSVSGGVVTLSNGSGFVNESSIKFRVLDSSVQSAQVLFTDDLALASGQRLRATIVDQKDATFFDAGWENAYAALEKIDIDMVVPLPSQTISSIFQNGRSHVESQSNIKNKHERMLFIGAISGLTPENVIGTEPAAVEDIGILEGIQGDSVTEVLSGNTEDLANYGVQDAFGGSFRVVYFYPDQIVVQVGSDRQAIDGFFIAAAAAGFVSATPNVNTPLTNKILSGFTILRNKIFAPIVLENIAAAGISVLQPVIGGGKILWGRTTTSSGFPEEEEISIVFIRDRIAKSMRSAFSGFIGVAETPTFQTSLYAAATDVMQAFISQQLITTFADLTVGRDEVEPRQWNIAVAVQPVYPVNWIYIKVNVGTI